MATPFVRLSDLLRHLFSGPELRVFVRRLSDGKGLIDALPERASLIELSSEVVDLLERRGRIDRDLFVELLDVAGPAKASQVVEVAAVWGVSGLSAAPASAAPPQATGNITIHGNVINVGGQIGTDSQAMNRSAAPAEALRPVRAKVVLQAPVAGTIGRARTGLSWDLFLAHASPDRAPTEAIFEDAAPCVRTFLDARLPLGGDWDQVIADALHSSAVIAVLVSKVSEEAYYLRDEIRVAIQRARGDGQWTRVVPVFLEGRSRTQDRLPYGIGLKQGLAVDERTSLSDVANALVQVVEEMRPRHHLARLFQRVFARSEALDGWLRALPPVEPTDDPYGLPDPNVAMDEAARHAVDVLVKAARMEHGGGLVFDRLADVHSGRDAIEHVRRMWRAGDEEIDE